MTRRSTCRTRSIHERIQAILCADSPLAGRPSVSLRDLANETLLLWERHAAPVLYDRILDLYARNGITPKTMPTPNAGPFNHAGMMLVASGKGLYLGYGVPRPARLRRAASRCCR